jgi:putative ABC transport system substrate-binding protein
MCDTNSQRPRRVGLLHLVGKDDPAVSLEAVTDFKTDLLSYGYVEGKSIEFRECYGNRDLDLVQRYADELVNWPADVIVSFMTNANIALMQSTREKKIPVVCWATDHIVQGTAQSYNRPGGNFTGFSYFPFVNAARVRMLKMAVPHAKKVGLLYNPHYAPAPLAVKEFGDDFAAMGIEMPVYEALTLDGFEPQIEQAKRDGCDAVMVGPHGLFNTNARLLGKLFLDHRMPGFGNQMNIPQTGGVAAMGPPYRIGWQNMGGMVDRLLKGENPAEIPIDRTRRGVTVVNTKAAEMLGLELPWRLIEDADIVLDAIEM